MAGLVDDSPPTPAEPLQDFIPGNGRHLLLPSKGTAFAQRASVTGCGLLPVMRLNELIQLKLEGQLRGQNGKARLVSRQLWYFAILFAQDDFVMNQIEQ